MITSKIVRAFLLVCLVGAGVLLSCEQLTARHVVVATFLATSAIELKPGAVAGLDASIPDAGSFDAGFLADAGFTIPPQTLVTVFFGQLQGTGLDQPPTGVPGAKVSIQEGGRAAQGVPEVGGGTYSLLGEDAGLAYVDNATYSLRIESAGATYLAKVEGVPPVERVTEFHQSSGFVDRIAGQAYTFNRPPPPSGQERFIGLVTVYPVSAGGKGTPTWTNAPKTPLDFLKLVVAPADWKQASVTVPGSAFPDRDRNYVILLQTGKLGGPTSNNLFAGSVFLVGPTEVGIVKTRP